MLKINDKVRGETGDMEELNNNQNIYALGNDPKWRE